MNVKKILLVIFTFLLLNSCGKSSQILGTVIDQQLWEAEESQLVIIGKITKFEKDENLILVNGFEFSYLTISITQIVYSDFLVNVENEIKILYSSYLEAELYYLSVPKDPGYCLNTDPYYYNDCISTEIEFYKDISYQNTDNPRIQTDFQFTDTTSLMNVNLLFYIRNDFMQYDRPSGNCNFQHFQNYKENPDYYAYFGGLADFEVLDGLEWSYNVSLSFREQTEPKIVDKLSALVNRIDIINSQKIGQNSKG